MFQVFFSYSLFVQIITTVHTPLKFSKVCAFSKLSFFKKERQMTNILWRCRGMKNLYMWECLISPWGQSWERVLHKHKCCDLCTSACAKPFPKIVPMAKLHSLIHSLCFISNTVKKRLVSHFDSFIVVA